LTERVSRLLQVDHARQVLAARYPDVDAWLAQARQTARIVRHPAEQAAGGTTVANLPVAPWPGVRAPDLELPDLAGKSTRLGQLRGRPVLINFWATWCPPCQDELPVLQTAHQQYGERVVVMGIDLEESKETVAAFLAGRGITYSILLDQNGGITNGLYQVQGLPTSLFIGADGLVSARHVGPLTEADIDRYLAPLLTTFPPGGELR
jgi:thiol-disulfide isomerase/thioredoxin